MRGVVGLCALLAVVGCASFQGGSEDSAWATVRTNPDSLLRVARTQLEHHGFTVRELGDRSLITVPRPVPNYLTEVSTEKQRPQQWFLRVNVDPVMLLGGSRLEVVGYVLPDQARAISASQSTAPKEAIQISSDNRRLFGEVRAVAGWISDAGKRQAKR